MNDDNQGSRRIALAAAAVIVIALAAGFAVMRLSSGGAESPAPSADPGGPAADPGGRGGEVDVAALLPDSEADLQEAAGVAREFTAAYFGGAADRGDRLAELATPGFADMLAQEGAAPPVQGEPVPTASAEEADVETEVTAIRDLAEGSVTYVVRADVTASSGAERRFEYAATVAERGGGWRVSGFHDAALGDAGAR
ncbi:hypothetical protein [Streptomonospora arabica]|uniref:Mce-associated membrane protein n=1 Tax=Streptomonospora arabica TaxID=412417 RepID=A0ABV9SLD0_9ACTN